MPRGQPIYAGSVGRHSIKKCGGGEVVSDYFKGRAYCGKGMRIA